LPGHLGLVTGRYNSMLYHVIEVLLNFFFEGKVLLYYLIELVEITTEELQKHLFTTSPSI